MSTTTTAQLVELIYDDLAAWAKENGGECYLSKNPFDLVNILEEAPGGWRITLHWEGDEQADPRVRDSQVRKNSIRVILDGRLGMSARPSLSLIKGSALRTPFLALLDAVQARMLAYVFPWLSAPNNRLWYLGSDDKLPLPDGTYAAAYNMNFALFSVKAAPDADIPLEIDSP